MSDPRSPSIDAKSRPHVRGSIVTVLEIVRGFLAGESFAQLAQRFELDERHVEDAVRYHMNHPPPPRRPIRYTRKG